MKSRVGQCPSCGAVIEFEVSSSRVAICEHCHSAIVRGDQRLEDFGKVADLAPSRSPLKVGLQGRFRDKPFELVGRVQYQHPAGGVWNEWYMSFSSRRWGWLAEAQGRFYLTFERSVKPSVERPAYESLEIGAPYNLGGDLGTFKVAEKNEAVAASAEGEIPWSFRPGTMMRFADLEGEGRRFATLDYSEAEAKIYVGDEIELSELGLRTHSNELPAVPKVATLQVSCPNCGGPLALVAPDDTQRVTCPNCNSLLDADKGALTFLNTLKPPKIQPVIPIGRAGTIEGVEYTVIGYLVRSVTIDGEVYRWQEYLLFSASQGFRWLVHSDGHWSFVRAVSVGEVGDALGTAAYGGRTFRLFQRAEATVRNVLGEFYWKVQVGETVVARDYIDPPYSLSIETGGQEQNISFGRYMPHAEVEQAFGVIDLRRGWGIAPNQPPVRVGSTFAIWAGFALLMFLVDFIFSMRSGGPQVDHGYLGVALLLISVLPVGLLLYRWQFEARRWQDSEFSPYARNDDDSDD